MEMNSAQEDNIRDENESLLSPLPSSVHDVKKENEENTKEKFENCEDEIEYHNDKIENHNDKNENHKDKTENHDKIDELNTIKMVITFTCNFCDFNCHDQFTIEEHLLRLHGSLKCFECSACNAKFPLKKQFESHVKKVHLHIAEYVCQICSDRYFDRKELLSHLHVHAKSITIPCEDCSAVFSTPELLSDHISTNHKAVEGKVKKPRVSRKVRSTPQRHPCNFCSYVSSCSSLLRIHICRKHTGERPFVCEVCGKKFAIKPDLKTHQFTHTGEKPFKCKYCETGFTTATGRRLHQLRKHIKCEGKHACPYCSMKFHTGYKLKKHIELHSTANFMCSFCRTPFSTNRALKRHTTEKHQVMR